MARRFLIIAHRGASGAAPESTRSAIAAAVRAGADMIELDVQMTRDGRLVAFHDDRLDRTTDGQGRLVDQRYARIARLDAGRWFHPRFAGERVLLVSQALRLVPRSIRMNLELKSTPRRRAVLERLHRLIRRAGAARRVLLSSFDPALISVRSGRIPRALICRRQPDASLRRAMALRCSAWHPHVSLVTARRVAWAHAAGLRVHAWTVDRPAQARRLLRCGVDGVFTNHPRRLRGVRA